MCLITVEKELKHLKRSISAEAKFQNRRELETYLFSSENTEFFRFVKMKDRSTISKQSLELILSFIGIGLFVFLGGNVANTHLHYSHSLFLYLLGTFLLVIIYSIITYERNAKKCDS